MTAETALGRAIKAEHKRDEARAKLARVRETMESRYTAGDTAHDTIGRVLRIIDEKEGGM